MKILVVEDEEQIAEFVRRGLVAEGFEVDVCDNGDDGYAFAKARIYDAIVLDIMLPGRDGLSILRSLREERNAVPVLLLTARGELDDRVEGLKQGADDYLAKPFFNEELAARLQALIRRTSGERLSELRVADLTVNLITREVSRGDRQIELTPREFSLLTYLMRSPGHVYTRTQILEHVWEYFFNPGTNVVDVHIRRLRAKLSLEGEAPIVETVRGVGYRTRLSGGTEYAN
jgi:DNA-binding response OmpR family regulator